MASTAIQASALNRWFGEGEARTHAAFAWSSDSTQLAYAASGGSLIVKDLRLFDQSTIQTIDATDSCAAPCSAGDTFAFQP